MKKLIVVACLVLGAGILAACQLAANDNGVVATAVAQEKGCSNIGTWVTAIPAEPFNEDDPDDYPPWISTDFGLSASSGTIVTDVPRWPNIKVVVPGTTTAVFPEAVRMTELKGVWERTGGHAIAFTQIGWAVDKDGNPQYVVRNSGTTTFTDDCNTENVKSTVEWFCTPSTASLCGTVEQNPTLFLFAVELPVMTGYRLMVTPPPPIAQ